MATSVMLQNLGSNEDIRFPVLKQHVFLEFSNLIDMVSYCLTVTSHASFTFCLYMATIIRIL